MAAEQRFTLAQMIALVTAIGAMSGLGGAYTATATDAEQDTKIEALDRSIEKLEVEQGRTHDSVLVNGTKVDHMTGEVSELKKEMKEIQDLLHKIAIEVSK